MVDGAKLGYSEADGGYDGASDGKKDCNTVGCADGWAVGLTLGCVVCVGDGVPGVGNFVGFGVGDEDGDFVGGGVGEDDGFRVGEGVAFGIVGGGVVEDAVIGDGVGGSVGPIISQGAVRLNGDCVGMTVGETVSNSTVVSHVASSI